MEELTYIHSDMENLNAILRRTLEKDLKNYQFYLRLNVQ